MVSLCTSSPTNMIECFMTCLLGCGSVFGNRVPNYNPRCKGQVTFFNCQPLCLQLRQFTNLDAPSFILLDYPRLAIVTEKELNSTLRSPMISRFPLYKSWVMPAMK